MSQDRQNLPSEYGGFSVSAPGGFELKVTPTLELFLNRSSSLSEKKCVSDIILNLLSQIYFILFQISAFTSAP